LSDFYGEPVPRTARLLESYLRSGRLPLRDPDDGLVTVDLAQAAAEFGGDLDASRSHLHRLHAAGLLRIDEDGVVELSRS
jgi:hypothetical protein